MPRVATFCPRCGESIDTELPEEARTAGRAELACPSCKFRFVIAPAAGAAQSAPENGEEAAPDDAVEETSPEEGTGEDEPRRFEPQASPPPPQGEEASAGSTGFPQASDARVTPKKQRSGALPARLLSASLLLFFAAALGLFAGIFFTSAPAIFDDAMSGPPGSGELSGVVYGPGREPLQGATVSVLEPVDEGRPGRDTPPTDQVETDQEGNYEFTSIDPGARWLRVELDGYQTAFLETMVMQAADQPGFGGQEIWGEVTLLPGAQEESTYESRMDSIEGILKFAQVWAWIAIPAALLAALGGVMVLVRRGFALSVVGAVAGMVAFGLLAGFVMALVALILVLTAKHEFLPLKKKSAASQ